MKKKRNSILNAVHETAKGLYDIGLMDVVTMHEFDSLCLKPAHKMTPHGIKKIRLREKVSQPVFALYLNVSPSTVKKWETGEKQPSGAALRLLNIVESNGLSVINLQSTNPT